ncbi:MAG: SMP-30/gluconolactonase/LRE family protein [Anaerolineales bacterium]|nr:SMP-30/gluconolactonase/LRE family protein [Anaerolineales bacterium]
MQAEIVLDAQAELGEGPAWDVKTGTLYWVDILGRRIHYHCGDENGFIQLDEMPGCLAPSRDGSLLVAARASILKLELATVKTTVLASVDEPANNRFNDGKCDPAGRFLAGSMNMDEKTPSGALYSFNGQTVTSLLTGIRISNGLAWSPDHKTLYYIDTPTREVKAFAYDLSTGQIAEPRVVIRVPESLGWPDGMTSDTDGNLWIAMWSGASITRWNPRNGDLLEQIPLSAKNVTSCAFGGENLDELYITSARVGLDKADLTAYRYSGSLMRMKTKVQGMPTFEFG